MCIISIYLVYTIWEPTVPSFLGVMIHIFCPKTVNVHGFGYIYIYLRIYMYIYIYISYLYIHIFQMGFKWVLCGKAVRMGFVSDQNAVVATVPWFETAVTTQ